MTSQQEQPVKSPRADDLEKANAEWCAWKWGRPERAADNERR